MSNLNFNQVNMAGRLTRDPEVRVTPGNLAVCRFSIAVNRRAGKGKEDVTDFFNVTVWRSLADVVGKFFKKGSAIMLSGILQTSKWKDDKGTEHYGVEIVADKVYFVDSLNGGKTEVAIDAPDEMKLESVGEDDILF